MKCYARELTEDDREARSEKSCRSICRWWESAVVGQMMDQMVPLKSGFHIQVFSGVMISSFLVVTLFLLLNEKAPVVHIDLSLPPWPIDNLQSLKESKDNSIRQFNPEMGQNSREQQLMRQNSGPVKANSEEGLELGTNNKINLGADGKEIHAREDHDHWAIREPSPMSKSTVGDNATKSSDLPAEQQLQDSSKPVHEVSNPVAVPSNLGDELQGHQLSSSAPLSSRLSLVPTLIQQTADSVQHTQHTSNSPRAAPGSSELSRHEGPEFGLDSKSTERSPSSKPPAGPPLYGSASLDIDEAILKVNNAPALPISTSSSLSSVEDQDHDRGTQKSKVEPAEDNLEGWIQFPYLTTNETEELMLPIRQNGTRPCHHIRTQAVRIQGPWPEPNSYLHGQQLAEDFERTQNAVLHIIQLLAGPVYELTITSIGDNGKPRCAGGDYFETDLSGPRWKSRPPVLDRNDGTYLIRLQMDPRFAASGPYTFSIILLFTNFNGLRYHPRSWARVEEVASFQIEFQVPDRHHSEEKPLITLPKSISGLELSTAEDPNVRKQSTGTQSRAPRLELPMCRLKDFSKKYWSGRWTRENASKECDYDNQGRWRCVDENLRCQKPWCEGRVGALESNGWVYSAHCAFKIFEKEEAWKCLDGKWLFFWGDSNHIDTIRNLLNFVLGFEHRIKFLDRRMDITYFSPHTNQSSVRITSMFNGHSNVSKNYEGLFSLHNPEFAAHLRSFFTGDTAPDFMIMNSGLHDGVFWKDVERFKTDGVDFAADFWADVWNKMRARRPDLLYRTTVSTGGKARSMAFNPQKLELFNHLMLDRFLGMNLERFHIIDGFDYTYPWHYDHKTNDGVHYGRLPLKSKWAGGNIGHRYFVDLMLIQMLLNAICPHS